MRKARFINASLYAAKGTCPQGGFILANLHIPERFTASPQVIEATQVFYFPRQIPATKPIPSCGADIDFGLA
ncbi:hypothetical protein AWQ22_15020 (plasmid) [Picosynechococcus sp. PCC 7117]|nr:hypothetical protein AWQ22_15020 [Picosynechococcus sp. PCC 7117]